ncbi:MAG: ribosomal RNA small subunit methyltransferase H [Oligoflexia bacterium]|nr:MAG: ribosomal RNA small subunit methyltransferase H [Oligoflexia bacterium]
MPSMNQKNSKQGSPLHTPVMLKEILEAFDPVIKASEQPRYFDGTFGRGGHLKALLDRYPHLTAVATDRDPEAIEYGRHTFAKEIEQGRLELVHCNFSDFDAERFGLFDCMLIDLGVSSPQLDQGQRGFSFYHEGPLDMRMDTTQGSTAADLVNTLDEEELNKLFQELGEIPKPYRVVRAIVHDRKEKPFETTRELAGLIERVEGWRRKGFHPATQYFMGLRLKVNQELESVEKALTPLIHGLKSKGRFAVLTFHSLEDRIVKNVFKDREELGAPLTKKVIKPEWNETKDNPRARSAKLRVFVRSGDDDGDEVVQETGRGH